MTEKQILLVDDNKKRLDLLLKTIRDMGFKQLVTAFGADTAWVTLKNKKIDCIICAYEMREMTGLALLRIIRQEDDYCDVPFYLTDNAFTKIKVIKAGQTGVTGLFVIPYDKNKMKNKLISSFQDHEEPVVVKIQKIFEQGMQLIEKKEYDKALDTFASLVHQNENPEYYFNIGYIKTSQGRHGEAIEAFSKATRLDRLFAKAYEEMGRVYRLMGDVSKAEEYLQLAAEIYMDTDKIGAAEEVLNEILESGTDSLNVFNTLGVLYRKKGDTQVALKQYKKALKVHPDEPYIYYNIGRLYLDLKQTDPAKDYFLQALEKDNTFKEAKQVLKAIDLGMV